MRRNPQRRKTYTVLDEQSSPNHLYREWDDVYGIESWCGQLDRRNHTVTETISECNCYRCLDIAVEFGKKCAERLTELPPRVS